MEAGEAHQQEAVVGLEVEEVHHLPAWVEVAGRLQVRSQLDWPHGRSCYPLKIVDAEGQSCRTARKPVAWHLPVEPSLRRQRNRQSPRLTSRPPLGGHGYVREQRAH